jgi:hypothetical protein
VVEGCVSRSQFQYLETHGISFSKLLEMQDLGLLSGVESIGLTRQYKSAIPSKLLVLLRSHGKALLVENDDATKVLSLEVYILTSVGAQLLGLGSFEPDIEYLRLIGKEITGKGFNVQLVDWEPISEKQIRYLNPEKIDA